MPTGWYVPRALVICFVECMLAVLLNGPPAVLGAKLSADQVDAPPGVAESGASAGLGSGTRARACGYTSQVWQAVKREQARG